MLEALEADELDQVLHVLVHLGPSAIADDFVEESHVLLNRAPRQQHGVLEDKPEAALPARLGGGLAIDENAPGADRQDVADEFEDSRLAAS